MLPLTFKSPRGRALRLLCLGAHADDIEIGCGGTILRLLEEHPKSEVVWVVFSGDAVRRREARASACEFVKDAGGAKVRSLDFQESFFPDQWAAIKRRFERVRREVEPDIVFTHTRDDRHQDHRVLWELTWNTFRDQLILEYEIPKYEGDLGQPNLFVSLSRRLAGQKSRLILKHFKSQRTKHWFDAETFMGLMRLRGVESGMRYAEGFYFRKGVL